MNKLLKTLALGALVITLTACDKGPSADRIKKDLNDIGAFIIDDVSISDRKNLSDGNMSVTVKATLPNRDGSIETARLQVIYTKNDFDEWTFKTLRETQ